MSGYQGITFGRKRLFLMPFVVKTRRHDPHAFRFSAWCFFVSDLYRDGIGRECRDQLGNRPADPGDGAGDSQPAGERLVLGGTAMARWRRSCCSIQISSRSISAGSCASVSERRRGGHPARSQAGPEGRRCASASAVKTGPRRSWRRSRGSRLAVWSVARAAR